jgi:hypothetical protein
MIRQRGIAPGRHHPGTPGDIISECLGDIIGIRTMLLSDAVGADERQILGLPLPLRRSLTTTQKQFLRYHRRSHNFG